MQLRRRCKSGRLKPRMPGARPTMARNLMRREFGTKRTYLRPTVPEAEAPLVGGSPDENRIPSIIGVRISLHALRALDDPKAQQI